MNYDVDLADEVAADARNRAWRTLVQGVGVDALVAVLAVLVTVSVDDIVWSSAYWLALGGLVARSAIVAVVAAVARRVVPPAY